jgi:hypothetical protein
MSDLFLSITHSEQQKVILMVVPANRRFHFAGELMLIQSTVAAIDFSYAVPPRLRRSPRDTRRLQSVE